MGAVKTETGARRWRGRGRGAALLYLLGSLAYVPGAILLHPAVSVDREYEAVAFYIAGSAAMTLAAALDYSSGGGSTPASGHQLLGGIDIRVKLWQKGFSLTL